MYLWDWVFETSNQLLLFNLFHKKGLYFPLSEIRPVK